MRKYLFMFVLIFVAIILYQVSREYTICDVIDSIDHYKYEECQ